MIKGNISHSTIDQNVTHLRVYSRADEHNQTSRRIHKRADEHTNEQTTISLIETSNRSSWSQLSVDFFVALKQS